MCKAQMVCGKSLVAAAIAGWWCASDPGADRFCLLTAPNAALVRIGSVG